MNFQNYLLIRLLQLRYDSFSSFFEIPETYFLSRLREAHQALTDLLPYPTFDSICIQFINYEFSNQSLVYLINQIWNFYPYCISKWEKGEEFFMIKLLLIDQNYFYKYSDEFEREGRSILQIVYLKFSINFWGAKSLAVESALVDKTTG